MTKPSRQEVFLDLEGVTDLMEWLDLGAVDGASTYGGNGCGVDGPIKESESDTEPSDVGVGICG